MSLNNKSLFSGAVMSRNKVVVKIEKNNIIEMDKALAPLYIIKTNDFEGWLRMRSIDLHRTNSRVLKKILRLNTNDEMEIVLSSNAATITDTYWVKEESSTLFYRDIRFTKDTFNYGLLRDVNTGEILNLAPNFDNNLALISRGYAKSLERNDLMVKLFLEVIENVEYKIPLLTKELVEAVAKQVKAKVHCEIDINYIVNFCMNAYYKIR